MSKLGDLIPEAAKRDYKDEYKKFQSSTKSKKYRAELNKYNRKKGTYGNGDGKDASHKNGKIVGFESQSKNRGRAEKSRLKKEVSSINEKAYVDMNATFELKGFDTNIFIKGKTTEVQLSFKGDDLQKALEKGKGKGKVVMVGVKTND